MPMNAFHTTKKHSYKDTAYTTKQHTHKDREKKEGRVYTYEKRKGTMRHQYYRSCNTKQHLPSRPKAGRAFSFLRALAWHAAFCGCTLGLKVAKGAGRTLGRWNPDETWQLSRGKSSDAHN